MNKQTSADTALNMAVVMSMSSKNKEDIDKIIGRFKYFRNSILRKGTLKFIPQFGGLFLNMREFIRAMEIGTTKTKRKKSVGSQKSPRLCSIATQTYEDEFIMTPDIDFDRVNVDTEEKQLDTSMLESLSPESPNFSEFY